MSVFEYDIYKALCCVPPLTVCSEYDTIDSCVWTQCLYPPDPPTGNRLASTWSGDPVDFYGNVSYVCEEEGLYFEWDREMEEFNITCQLGGGWDEPLEWPVCLPSKIVFSVVNSTRRSCS